MLMKAVAWWQIICTHVMSIIEQQLPFSAKQKQYFRHTHIVLFCFSYIEIDGNNEWKNEVWCCKKFRHNMSSTVRKWYRKLDDTKVFWRGEQSRWENVWRLNMTLSEKNSNTISGWCNFWFGQQLKLFSDVRWTLFATSTQKYA